MAPGAARAARDLPQWSSMPAKREPSAPTMAPARAPRRAARAFAAKGQEHDGVPCRRGYPRTTSLVSVTLLGLAMPLGVLSFSGRVSAASTAPAGVPCNLLATSQLRSVLHENIGKPEHTLSTTKQRGCEWSAGGVEVLKLTWVANMRRTPENYYRRLFPRINLPKGVFRSIAHAGAGAVEVVSGGPFGTAVVKKGHFGLVVSLSFVNLTKAGARSDIASLARDAWAKMP